MKILLVGGAPNTGKTETLVYIANYLVNKGFNLILCTANDGNKINLPSTVSGTKQAKDFFAHFGGKNIHGKEIKITITSPSDNSDLIDKSYNFIKKNPADIFISSIRDIGFERKYFIDKFNLLENYFYEFPLAKMSRKNNNWFTAKRWYESTVHKIIEFILKSFPFEI